MLRLGWVNIVIAACVLASVTALGGCGQFSPPYLKPLSAQTQAMLAEKGMSEQSPILVRIFKSESELEVWKAKEDGRFYHFKTYPICDWSGKLGPKINQGDRQAPEGFYMVSAPQMNPKSKYYLAFNIGFPNSYDRAYGRTGADIMVHGDCKSSGCYAMTDGVVEEIYILAREAIAGGQGSFQVQAFPFRMTTANLAKHKDDQWYGFWQNLKEGYDYFEITRQPPKVDVCDKRYLINASFVGGTRPSATGACPAFEKLPVQRAPRERLQEASAKSKERTAEVGLGRPLGSWFGLTFGPPKEPAYQAFTLGPATPATPVPTPTKPVKAAAKAKAEPKQAAAPKAKAWSAAATTVTAEK
jgi:murein L,D-transpeptidase YafK